MVYDGRYIGNAQTFKQKAHEALGSHFVTRDSFDAFYESLISDEKKDEFLRVTCFYLYLVKQGDWHVNVQGSNPIIDYFTNTFKLVALFSLIESLSDARHQDFHEWLCNQDPATIFPIADRYALQKQYDNYKSAFGSIKRCSTFFDRLAPQRKQNLCDAIRIDGKPLPSIKRFAEFLYNLRSEFVHEARLVLQVCDGPIISFQKTKINGRL